MTMQSGDLDKPQLTAVPAGPAKNTLLELRDVCVYFPVPKARVGRSTILRVRAVDGVSFTVTSGETLGLVGQSGSGKSTLAHLVMGMITATSGSVLVDGEELKTLTGSRLQAARRLVQVVPQDPYRSLDPRMRIGEIISEPLTYGSLRKSGPAVRERVAELLELVGLSSTSTDRYAHQFSGGQRQRIAIARALASTPRLLVLDEPTSSLDVSIRAQILNLLKRLQLEFGLTYLFISHDIASVSYLSSRIAVMHSGKIVEMGPTVDVCRSPAHPYTRVLLDSVPGTGARASGVIAVAGEPVALSDGLPQGCRFHPRCPYRRAAGDPPICHEHEPPLQGVGPSHWSACHFADNLR
jgi:oligopeptide/dipeptide ABC transporter ATP-binding protein